MNERRARILYEQQTAVAQRVFDAVPITERWDAKQIATEMGRAWRPAPSFHILEGCLSSLHEQGLIHAEGNFRQRVFWRDVLPLSQPERRPTLKAVKNEEPPMAVTEPKAATPSTFDRITALCAKLSAIAEELSEIALDIEADLEASKSGDEKLRQLKKLLKEL